MWEITTSKIMLQNVGTGWKIIKTNTKIFEKLKKKNYKLLWKSL